MTIIVASTGRADWLSEVGGASTSKLDNLRITKTNFVLCQQCVLLSDNRCRVLTDLKMTVQHSQQTSYQTTRHDTFIQYLLKTFLFFYSHMVHLYVESFVDTSINWIDGLGSVLLLVTFCFPYNIVTIYKHSNYRHALNIFITPPLVDVLLLSQSIS